MVYIVITLSGCGKQIEDFVKDGITDPISNIDPTTTTSSSKAIKVSPGSGIAKGSQVEGRFTITPTDRTISGSQVEAKLTLSQTRVD